MTDTLKRRRRWPFMSRRKLRRELEIQLQVFNERADEVRDRGDDVKWVEYYAGAAWGARLVKESLLYTGRPEQRHL